MYFQGWSTCCADGDSDSDHDYDMDNNHKQTSQLIDNSDNDQQKLTILNDDHYDSWFRNSNSKRMSYKLS